MADLDLSITKIFDQPREKEFPQPHDEVALGFLMAKEAPIISST